MVKFDLTEMNASILRDFSVPDGAISRCMGIRFTSGEAIFREGHTIDYIGIIIHGTAKACTSSYDGKDLTVCYYDSEGVVGDIELMSGLSTATATLIAVTELECLQVPYTLYQAELLENAAFNIRLAQALAKKVLRNCDSFKYAALYSGEARLCTYLLQMSYRGVLKISLTDVSRSLGISYRHLQRLMHQLCAEGLVAREGNGYQLLDLKRLRRKSYLMDCAQTTKSYS